MIIYSLLFILTYTFFSLDASFKRVPKLIRPGFYIAVFLLFVVIGLRAKGGVDYDSYVQIFETLGTDWYTSEKLERGFYYLNYIVKYFGFDAYLLIALSFLISIFLILDVIRRYSEFPGLSILILFGSEVVFMLQNTLRQGLAIAFCFYATRFVFERKAILFFLIIIFGSTFHLSALVFLPVYFILALNLSLLRWLSLLALWVSMLLYFNDSIVVNLVVKINETLLDGRYSKIIVMATSMDRTQGLRPFLNFFIGNLLLLMCFTNRFRLESEVFIFLTVLGFSLSSLLGGFMALDRIGYYFSIYSVIAIPLLVKFWSRSSNKILTYAACFLVYGVLFYRVLLNDGHDVLPYQSLVF